jgi:hypothetical protein
MKKWFTFLGVLCLALTSYSASNPSAAFTLNCPANVYVSCTDELWDLSIYGNATYTIGYHTYSAGTPVVTYQLNSCNVGTIKRKWTVEDPYWNLQTCTQIIYVSSSGYADAQITWPKDYELSGCNPNTNPNSFPSANAYPTWTSSECSMLGRSYSDMLFTVTSQCKKVLRTWTVLDWCNKDSYGQPKKYIHKQFIKLINDVAPTFTCPSDVTVNATNCKDAHVSVAPLIVPPSSCGGDFEITNNSPYATTKGANISGRYPVGTTKVAYSIKYGCGSIKTCHVNVVVKNASQPSVYCIGSLITALMPVDSDKDGDVDNGMVELWAKDFDKGSSSLCGFYPLTFSFSKDSVVMRKTFTCDHIGKNEVPIYVTDSKGGRNYCIVTLIVQNNGANIPNCHPAPPTDTTDVDTTHPTAAMSRITGSVKSLADKPLSGADIRFTIDAPIVNYTYKHDTTEVMTLDSFINASGFKLYRFVMKETIVTTKDSTLTYISESSLTDIQGNYLIDSLPLLKKKSFVTATYSDAPRQSINSADVELLTKFLLGELTFTSYPQYLAADVDENGVINIEDQNTLMRFVTGQISKLPGQHAWYVLNAKAQYVDPKSVLLGPLPTRVWLDSLGSAPIKADFVAIKKGNISVDPTDVNSPLVDARTRLASTGIIFYPNPTFGSLTMDIHAMQPQAAQIEILNTSGQVVFKLLTDLSTGKNSKSFDLSSLPTGMLLYRVIVDQKVHTGSIQKL